MSTTVEAKETNGPPAQSLGRSLGFIGYAALITTLAQTQVLGALPVKLWLKNHLHVDAPAVAGFTFLSGLAWYAKPVFGLLIDAVPFFGTRRRGYMILSSVLAAIAWLLISLGQGSYNLFLYGAIALGICMVVASTIMGALLVEAGQKMGATGRVSAVREAVQNGCYIISGPLGGWLAYRAFGLTAGIGAGMVLSLAVAAWFFLPEKPVARVNSEVWTNAGRQLRLVFASKTLWAAAGLLVLFFFSPGFATPLLYRQQNMLGFSDGFLGTLVAVDGVALVIGAWLYSLLCKRFTLKTLLPTGIACYAVAALFYWNYHPQTHLAAIEIEVVYNILQGVGVLPLFDLATRATPKGGEGMGYALMMSARNVALFGADWVGSKLQAAHIVNWDGLVSLNAGTTLVCLLLVPFLPRILMQHKDGENFGDSGGPSGEQISAVEPGRA